MLKNPPTTYDKSQVKIPVKETGTAVAEFKSVFLSVKELVQRFLGFCQTNRAPATVAFYRNFLDTFAARHGPTPSDQITALNLEDFKQLYISKGKSIATVNHAVISVKVMFSWAENYNLLEKNPVAKVKKIPRERHIARFLSEEEEKVLFDTAK